DAGAMRPDFSSRERDFNRISYADAIAGTLDAKKVKDRAVLIGLTANGSGDFHLTPIGSNEPGIAATGNALNSLLEGHFVRDVSRATIALSLVPLLAVTMYAVPRLNIRQSLVIVLLFAAAFYAFQVALFKTDQRLVLNYIYPALLLITLYLIG